MAAPELLSDEGYRADGRRPAELRKVRARMGVFAQADGSAYIEQGNTKALAVVYGPHEMRGSRSKALPDRAVVNCQYSMATFSTGPAGWWKLLCLRECGHAGGDGRRHPHAGLCLCQHGRPGRGHPPGRPQLPRGGSRGAAAGAGAATGLGEDCPAA
uniref:Exoribonuclease phosphorolytic domain-containing protein n=1 Tax=Falco tinnunculus TaxID=100819 RepID=A0A8C4XQF6_FALTI